MNLEGLATDTLNLPGIKTLRHVASAGQNTFESVSTAPIGQCCMFARPNGTKRQVFVDTPRDGMPSVIHHKRRLLATVSSARKIAIWGRAPHSPGSDDRVSRQFALVMLGAGVLLWMMVG